MPIIAAVPESEPVSLSFGVALRESRRAAGLSQRELAERTQLDFSYISKLENGRLPPPSADTVLAICRVLDIPAEDLLALAGKIPTQVQQSLSASKTAQRFLLEAQRLGLTDEEWTDLTQSLQRLRSGDA